MVQGSLSRPQHDTGQDLGPCGKHIIFPEVGRCLPQVANPPVPKNVIAQTLQDEEPLTLNPVSFACHGPQ